MKIRPLHDRVIVKRLDQERKTASGIVIPDNAAEKPDQGEIMAVGPGKRDENSSSCVKKTSWASSPNCSGAPAAACPAT
jgi:chaperonin GroES